MAEHNLLGKAGEDAAVDYLERHDYVIRKIVIGAEEKNESE